MVTKIKNGRFVFKDRIKSSQNLYFKDDEILEITEENLPCDNEIDAMGCYVSPGFIDIHTHGGGGCDFMDGSCDAIITAANMHLMHGTTSILPTSLACSTDVLLDFLRDLKTVMEKSLSKSRILGTHLEGPYFSLEQRGAQNSDYIKAPDKNEYEKIEETGRGIIKRWSFAPELPQSEDFCNFLILKGILPSIAHSNATLAEIMPIYNAGCRMVTHLYSGMSTISRDGGFRRLGVIESTYLLDGMQAEIIADGCHLPPELLKLIVKNLGCDNLILVTDSMRGAGMGEGISYLGREAEKMPCIIEDGVAKVMDKSSFAGSVATADRLVRVMVQKAGVSITDAVKMITLNPAKLLNYSHIGELSKGKKADIVIFDDNINIKKVIANGNTINL